MSSDIFITNLHLLSSKNPTLALLIKLNLHELGAVHFIHSPKKEREAKKHLSSLSIHSKTRLIFFGLGQGYCASALKEWLDQNPQRELIFFENELQNFKELLSSSRGTFLLQHPQIHLFYPQTLDFWEVKLKAIQKLLSQPFLITALPSDLKGKKKAFEDFSEKLIDLSVDQNTFFAEYLSVSPLVYKNFLRNLTKLNRAKSIYGLKNAFRNFPAIICGAGPSLDKQAPLLSQIRHQALLFSGGRSLNVLNDFGIEPHFSIGIDPFPQHKRTFGRNHTFEIPLIYRNRIFHEVLDLAHGELLYTPGAIGYSFVSWIEQMLGIESPFFEEGLNVVNFNLKIAELLGCHPIILVGCDLAYTHQKAYSESIPDEQDLPKMNEFNSEDLTLNRALLKKNSSGQPLFTLWKWDQEALWIEAFAQKVPVINATEGGRALKGLEHLSLKEVSKKYLHQRIDLDSIVYQAIQNLPSFDFSLSLLDEKVELFLNSIQKAEQLFETFLKKVKSSVYNSLSILHLLEEDLKENLAYQHLLLPLEILFERVEIETTPLKKTEKKIRFLQSYLRKIRPVFKDFLDSSYKTS